MSVITFVLVVGFILGAEWAMVVKTGSAWWVGALIVSYVLAISGKPLSRFADWFTDWLKK